MILCQEFLLDKWDWNVKVFYVVDSIPIDFIISELKDLGCSNTDIESAVNILDTNEDNKGITFSNDSTRNTVIVIGETSCPAQFAHSYDHEKHHLAMHIAKVDKIDPFGEELAYLVGEIGFQTFQMAKWFMCDHCRSKLK